MTLGKNETAEASTEREDYPACGNALRIDNQSETGYPMTLIIHDASHLDIVRRAGKAFGRKYPFGYIGTSPWPGTAGNERTWDYADEQNRALYDYLRDQAEIGRVIYALCVEEERRDDIMAMIEDMREKCPRAEQIWVQTGDEKEPEKSPAGIRERLSEKFKKRLEHNGISVIRCRSAEETDAWLRRLARETGSSQPPSRYDTLNREWAEWTNISITLPETDESNRILLVGDSISFGYGDLVQRRMPERHVDRLNTSEGIHHPNFLRLLRIVLAKYPYRIIHINNGIHLHGQTVEEYKRNLEKVFCEILKLSPGIRIIFAATTPVSRRLSEEELTGYDAENFTMGDQVPCIREEGAEEYWVTDDKASAIYRELNAAAKEVCAERGIPVNDLYGICVKENLQKRDGVHFREEGYARLADRIAEVLKENAEDV